MMILIFLFPTLLFSFSLDTFQKIPNSGNLFPINSGDNFGISTTQFQDLDFDGINEILVGSSKLNQTGAVFLIYLAQDGSVRDWSSIGDDPIFVGELSNGDLFGSTVFLIDDLDMDGIAEVVVGAPEDDSNGGNAGAIYLFFFNGDGTVRSFEKITTVPFGLFVDGDDRFGFDGARISDLDQDGISEIVVGAPYDDLNLNEGALYILFLNRNATLRTFKKLSAGEGNFTVPLMDGDFMGSDVCNIDDLDGDGIDELVVSVQNGISGRVYVLFLNRNATVRAFQAISENEGNLNVNFTSRDWFGRAVTGLKDRDGDGKMELLVTSYKPSQTSTGLFYILFLNENGKVRHFERFPESDDNFISEIPQYSNFGSSASALDDIDGDGKQEILVGASGSLSTVGSIYLLFSLVVEESTIIETTSTFADISSAELSTEDIDPNSQEESAILSTSVILADSNSDSIVEYSTSDFDEQCEEITFCREYGDFCICPLCSIPSGVCKNENSGVFAVKGTEFSLQEGDRFLSVDVEDSTMILESPGIYIENLLIVNSALIVQLSDTDTELLKESGSLILIEAENISGEFIEVSIYLNRQESDEYEIEYSDKRIEIVPKTGSSIILIIILVSLILIFISIVLILILGKNQFADFRR